MGESSSEGSMDEEEVIRNFDTEAKIIVRSEATPKKSSDRYLLVYNTYKKWREDNKNSLSSSEENNLIVYFEELKLKLKPPTLWSIWSMLKKTLNVNDDVNIGNFLNLKSLIKSNAKGYKPRKAFVLRWNQIIQFMKEASDQTFLVMKVILIFGICGCLRCDEITNITVQDVEDLNDKYLVSINENKNDYGGQFIIGRVTIEPLDDNLDFNLNYADFDDDFSIDTIESGLTGVAENGFTTASNNPILIPNTKPNETNANKKCLFVDKPAIKLKFQQQSDIQPTYVQHANVQSPNEQQSNVQPLMKKCYSFVSWMQNPVDINLGSKAGPVGGWVKNEISEICVLRQSQTWCRVLKIKIVSPGIKKLKRFGLRPSGIYIMPRYNKWNSRPTSITIPWGLPPTPFQLGFSSTQLCSGIIATGGPQQVRFGSFQGVPITGIVLHLSTEESDNESLDVLCRVFSDLLLRESLMTQLSSGFIPLFRFSLPKISLFR
ncbi:Protein of unknown function [Cotesia congregata]|uniref:Uncharacterized protein n=1 Tax=Cotesia congregata TaxID=51543 RepID=A0A8J2HBA2_COTCN|nr:Protein of unknown function [Cotesia congregata]